MNNKTLMAVVAACLWLAAVQAPAGARRAGPSDDVSKMTQTKRLQAGTSAPGKSLRVDRTQAELTIAGWEKNEISVEATVEVGDSDPGLVKEFLENTTMTLEPEAGGFVLRLRSPLDWETKEAGLFKRLADALHSGHWDISFSARVMIRVPANQSLNVDNHFGDVAVGGVTGRIDIANASGGVRIEGCGGELRLTNSFGAVAVKDFTGPVDARNESGEIRAERISGRADLRNSFKDVQFAKINGPLTVTSESANVSGTDVAGDTQIKSSFKTIDVRGVRGRLEIRGESSEVIVDDAAKEVTIDSSFKPVRAKNVRGGLRVTGESAAVTAEGIDGDAWIKSSFQQITVSRVGGRLTVAGESASVLAEDIAGALNVKNSFKNVVLRRTSGSITVAGESSAVEVGEIKALPPGSAIEIRTSFKPIRVSLPAGTEVQGTAHTEFGKIQTDFPVYLNEARDSGGRSVSFGTGQTGVLLKLETSADITVKKD